MARRAGADGPAEEPAEQDAARGAAAAEKEAAATLPNRLVLLRHLEALGLCRPPIVTGGWNSKGYREFREFAPALCGDETEGYQTLLQLLFDELALDLPGLFGDVGLTRLLPIPAATLREVIERLDDPGLVSAWTDDTTLGWVYQYWNDPEREALDKKIADGGKIEPHEIASKTQMFTERYMVEWLLHNSLGLTWLCICKKHGWTPDAERVLPLLDERRAEWRKKRQAGEVALDALMPIEGELEEHWKHYVPQPIPDDAVAKAPDSIRVLKILDPACGSGHFLVIAFDLLVALYREEARHRGQTITGREIAESILENNLHCVDIDPRAVQIAAAALFLKVRSLSTEAQPKQVNLVAPALHLGHLPADDPALAQLRREIREETGIPEELTNRLVQALAGVDHLGTLLKVDAAVEEAIRGYETVRRDRQQGGLFSGFGPEQKALAFGEAKATVLDKLEQFLGQHSGEEDLGVRLDGEQLAAGLRFVRIVREGTYDIVVGNPPYSDLGLLAEADHQGRLRARRQTSTHVHAAKPELVRSGGLSALLVMRGWMFIKQFEELRLWLLANHDLRSLGDFDRGAFDEVPNDLLAVVGAVFLASAASSTISVAVQPSPFDDRSYDRARTGRKRAAVLLQVGRVEFAAVTFRAVTGWPLVYWWPGDLLVDYLAADKMSQVAPIRQGMATSDNIRFLRVPWELGCNDLFLARGTQAAVAVRMTPPWVPYIKGADGHVWIEPLRAVVNWKDRGLELKVFHEARHGSYSKRIPSESYYFKRGIAFSTIGDSFSARAHRWASIFDAAGCSVFPTTFDSVLCLMNSTRARFILQSLNPTISFKNNDVERLPLLPIGSSASSLKDSIRHSRSTAVRERPSSLEVLVSPWRVQDWAMPVDRSTGEPLPQPSTTRPRLSMSFRAVGVALGRFGANGEGVLDETPPSALPRGILYLSAASDRDSLKHPACAPLHAAWAKHGGAVGEGHDLRSWFRTSFFAHHKGVYENRPIYFPLSSAKRSFVAWISIHRWQADTLQILLADHLLPEQRALEGEIEDLRRAKVGGEKSVRGRAEKRFAEVQKLLEELRAFIDAVTACAEVGPPAPDAKTPPRERDARYLMDLDDGVMVNSAALWPLLEPQWKDPKKWWKELASAVGRKDYDWSNLAARYFPARVAKKCEADPSLAVAHGCFWRLHPAKAYAWELRLQDEIRADFTIDEADSNEPRARFLEEHPEEARAIEAAEATRRERKARKVESDAQAALFDEAGEDDDKEDADA